MTFASICYGFTCDSCGSDIEVFGSTDFDNIPSVTSLADHEFDIKISNHMYPPARITGGHICYECSYRADIFGVVAVDVETVKRIIAERVEELRKEQKDDAVES